jgi:hypothetical protein
MADLPPHPRTGDEPGEPPDRTSPWPAVLAVAVAVLVILLVVLHLTGTLGPGVH